MVFLRHFDLQAQALFLNTDEDFLELSVADISALTVHSALPQNSRKMKSEQGKVELILRDGTHLVFDVFLTVAHSLFKRLHSILRAVCNIEPRWQMP